MSKTLPVREWYMRFERIDDEAAAFETWRNEVVDREWSPVGDPWIVRDGADPAVVGRIIQHPGLKVNPDVRQVTFP